MFTSRQAARHVVVAYKKYFEAHLALKADLIRRSHARHEGQAPLAQIPAYKVRNEGHIKDTYFRTPQQCAQNVFIDVLNQLQS